MLRSSASIVWGVTALVLIQTAESDGQNTSVLPERAGYYDTTWPSEHCDLWRSHAAPGAGLPPISTPVA